MSTRVTPQTTISFASFIEAIKTTARDAGFTGTGMAVIRILTGYLWYTQLSWKVPWTKAGSNALHAYIVTESKYASIAPYRGFVAHVILPHFTFIAYVAYFTEMALAISLILGLLTRLGGLIGTLWAAQLYIGLSIAPGEWYWTYGMLVLLNAVSWVGATGRWWGVDQWLRPRLAQIASQGQTRAAQVAQWLHRAT